MRRKTVKYSFKLGLLSGMLGLSACAMVPKGVDAYSTDHLPTWIQSRNTQKANTALPPIEFKHTQWWKAVHDEALNQLIEEALKDSTSIREAAARTRLAQAQLGMSNVDGKPTLKVHSEFNKQQLSKNYYVPPAYAGTPMEQGLATLNTNWDLDLWGRQKKAIESAQGKVKAAEAEQALVSLKLSTQIAKVYVQLRWVSEYIKELQASNELNQNMVDLQETRLALGLDNGNGLDRAKDTQAQNQLQLDKAMGQKERFVAAIDSLIGNPELVQTALKTIPQGLPTPLLQYTEDQAIPLSLLARRPDLVGARFRLQAAAADVDATRLGALPNINLTGYVGYQSIGWDKLLKPDSVIGLLGAVLDFPIFDGGRVKYATEVKRAEFDVAKSQYESAITDAAQEVINEVLLLKQINHELSSQTNRLQTIESLEKRANNRKELGLDSSLPSLEAQINVHMQRTRLLETQLNELGNQVDLIQALGGGYENSAVQQDLTNANPLPQ